MKRVFGIIIVFLALYILLQIIFVFTVGKRISYYNLTIDNKEYMIKEVYTSRHSSINLNIDDKKSYYYEIKRDNNILFSFKILRDNPFAAKLLKDIIVYANNNLICIYPLFIESQPNIDVICNDNNKIYLYGSVKGQDPSLDSFIANLKTQGYNHDSWETTNKGPIVNFNFSYYKDNITEDQYISLWGYKGYYRITDNTNNYNELNIRNTNKPSLSFQINNYFVIPNYINNVNFNSFIINNIKEGSSEVFGFEYFISYNSFIQGIVDNKVYLIDIDNRKQYKIDIINKNIIVLAESNEDTKYYNKGKWETKTMKEVIDNKLTFIYRNGIPKQLEDLQPLKIDNIGGDTDGYYYLYFNENNNISVYRADKQNPSLLTLLFSKPGINRVKYIDNDIYFISNDTLYFYRDSLGLKPLIKYKDFIANDGDLYNIYLSK